VRGMTPSAFVLMGETTGVNPSSWRKDARVDLSRYKQVQSSQQCIGEVINREYGDRSHGDRSHGDRPHGDRPHGDSTL